MRPYILKFMNNNIKKSIPVFLLLFIILAISACSKNSESGKYGGTFEFAMSNEPKTFLARNVGDFYSATLLNQVYEGLVGLNTKTLQSIPCLAKSWTISKDGRIITFHLRDDVYFQQNKKIKGKIKLKPSDVVYSVELACTPLNGKEPYAYTYIYKNTLKGAQAFFQHKTDHISGLRVKGNDVIFELKERDVNFINKMALAPAAIISEKVAKAGLETELIGTGPFCFNGYKQEDGMTKIVLTKNENYWGKDENGNALPYLDKVVIDVVNDEMQQMNLFETGKTAFIDGLPPSKVSMMLGEGKLKDFNGTPPKLILVRKPLLGTQYYFFNCRKKPFDNKKVRKAFNYAVNRKYIVQNILKNQAYGIGDAGIVPPTGFKGYNAAEVKKHGYTFQPEKAKELLKDAGYPNGEGFPTVSIKYSIGSTNYEVANEIAMQLRKVLNVNVNLDGEPFDLLLQDGYNGKGDIFRSSWYADYFSPESFLLLGYGKFIPKDSTVPSKMNTSRYFNPKFDALMDEAKQADNIVDRYNNFEKAEAVLMDDAPFMILWYEETIKIVHSNVRNLRFNAGDYYLFKDVYLKDWTKQEWSEKHQAK